MTHESEAIILQKIDGLWKFSCMGRWYLPPVENTLDSLLKAVESHIKDHHSE